MADLEAVLADVSYLMAMEKSKSTPAARASKRIVLPDPSVRSVMHKYMEKNDEVSFEKIFHQKLGHLLFKEYCETLHDEPVPQLYFYEEIKKYERLETPEERSSAAKEIYDTYIMGELLGQTHRYSKGAIDYVHNHLARNEVPTSLFQPYIDEIYFILREFVYEKFLQSDKYTRFCQWKNLELNIQLTMNDFSVHRIIGRGGFGEVYGCRKADTGKMYAMKCLDKKRIKMKQGEMLALNERIMLSLVSTGEDCPFIVNMTYAFQTPEKLYFVLDLMNGGDLHYHLSQHGVFCESEMRFYAAEVILGLEHMHNRYVVYRDLKPANILLDENGHIRISDLGLACDFSKKRPHASVGTHGYMAPEVLCKGLPYDSSADWFSLGCVLYKLLKGHSPFRQHKTRDKHEIDKMTMTMNLEMPDSFSSELKSLLHGLLQRDVHKRLGCQGEGANELKQHPFFRGIDWRVVFLQRLPPPLIPARGEVNAADAFDIGSFDEEDTKHIRLTDTDQELYCNFPVVVSERWQHEIAETIFDYVNHEADKIEMKRKSKNKLGYQDQEEYSDCILHGYVKRLGGTFTATWLTRYMRLYPNRVELYSDSGKPELIFMDQIEEVCNDYVQIKNEQCIVIKMYNHSKYVFTNSDEIGLKEWHVSLKATHKESLDLLTTMAEKATKIYGAEIPLKRLGKRRQQLQQSLTLQEQHQHQAAQQQQQQQQQLPMTIGGTTSAATSGTFKTAGPVNQMSANVTANVGGGGATATTATSLRGGPTPATTRVAAQLEQKLIQDQLMSSKNLSRATPAVGTSALPTSATTTAAQMPNNLTLASASRQGLPETPSTTSSALSTSDVIGDTLSASSSTPMATQSRDSKSSSMSTAQVVSGSTIPPIPKPDVDVGTPAAVKEALGVVVADAGATHRAHSVIHRHHRSSSSSAKSNRSRRSHHSSSSRRSGASGSSSVSSTSTSANVSGGNGGHHHRTHHRSTCSAAAAPPTSTSTSTSKLTGVLSSQGVEIADSSPASGIEVSSIESSQTTNQALLNAADGDGDNADSAAQKQPNLPSDNLAIVRRQGPTTVEEQEGPQKHKASRISTNDSDIAPADVDWSQDKQARAAPAEQITASVLSSSTIQTNKDSDGQIMPDTAQATGKGETPSSKQEPARSSIDEASSSSSGDPEEFDEQDEDNSSSLVIDVDGKLILDPSKRITSNNYQRERNLVAQYEKLNISARKSPSNEEITKDE